MNTGEKLMALAVLIMAVGVIIAFATRGSSVEYNTLSPLPEPTGCWVTINDPERDVFLKWKCGTATPVEEER